MSAINWLLLSCYIKRFHMCWATHNEIYYAWQTFFLGFVLSNFRVHKMSSKYWAFPALKITWLLANIYCESFFLHVHVHTVCNGFVAFVFIQSGSCERNRILPYSYMHIESGANCTNQHWHRNWIDNTTNKQLCIPQKLSTFSHICSKTVNISTQ